MRTVFINYVYINTHTRSIYLENIYGYTSVYSYSYILLLYININSNVIYTHILCKQKLLFWMQLIDLQH